MDMTESEVRQILIEAMKAQLEKPNRAIVSSESSFVAQRLRESGYPKIAERYWYWVCKHKRNVEEFGEEIYNLQVELDKISRFDMPSWGTYGT